jgi:hypothetical protein
VPRLVGIAAISTLAALAATGCGGHGRTSLACGHLRPVTPTRDPAMAGGIALGPLQLDLYPFRQGYPLKVLIGAARPLRAPLTIRGWRCGDAVPLRFYYVHGSAVGIAGLIARKHSPAVLEKAGQAQAYLKPYPGSHDFWPGSFLFPTAGTYEVKLYSGGSLLDTAVISTAERAR